jgi:putative component of membrane protein insertase Oxa1/YidC/SpoIIIJ protein YidD
MKKILFCLIPFFLFAKIGFYEPWGKDHNLKYKTEKKEKKTNLSIMTKAANQVILFHQKVLSPTTGPRSSYRPTSSRYMQLAMQNYGFFRGYIMGCDRLLRENKEPWIYRKIIINNVEYKYDDPLLKEKYIISR